MADAEITYLIHGASHDVIRAFAAQLDRGRREALNAPGIEAVTQTNRRITYLTDSKARFSGTEFRFVQELTEKHPDVVVQTFIQNEGDDFLKIAIAHKGRNIHAMTLSHDDIAERWGNDKFDRSDAVEAGCSETDTELEDILKQAHIYQEPPRPRM